MISFLSFIKGQMPGDAMLLTVKIAGAEGGDLYDLRMEAAAIIRKAARDLMGTNHSLEMFGFKEVGYFDIVRDLIEEYRLLFIEWLAGFDKWNYILTAGRWVLSIKTRMTIFLLIPGILMMSKQKKVSPNDETKIIMLILF